MKIHAQDILQYSSYPLEPIVALAIKKSFEEKLKVVYRNYGATPHTNDLYTGDVVRNAKNWDIEWFNNYE